MRDKSHELPLGLEYRLRLMEFLAHEEIVQEKEE